MLLSCNLLFYFKQNKSQVLPPLQGGNKTSSRVASRLKAVGLLRAAVGIGLLLAFTGLQNLGVIAFDNETYVGLGK